MRLSRAEKNNERNFDNHSMAECGDEWALGEQFYNTICFTRYGVHVGSLDDTFVSRWSQSLRSN